jgi:hypothetical protein
LGALVLVFLLASLGRVLPASARPAAHPVAVRVDAGWGGWYSPGEHIPVRLTLSSPRLVRGLIQLSWSRPSSLATPVAVPIEIVGGTTKKVTVELDTAGDQRGATLDVKVTDGRTSVGLASQALQARSDDDELVALLPGALNSNAPPGPAPLNIDAGIARFSALQPGDLAAGPHVLDGLTVVAAGPGDLAALSPADRSRLEIWLSRGRELLVDSPPGDTIAGLSSTYQPGASGIASARFGRVIQTGGAMARGQWAGLVEPTAQRGSFSLGGDPSSFLLGRLGTRLIGRGWVGGLALLYVLLAGPIVSIVLWRLRRQELMWVVVPVLAIVMLAVALVGGTAARGKARADHLTILATGRRSTQVITLVGAVGRGRGTVSISTPPDFNAVGVPSLVAPNRGFLGRRSDSDLTVRSATGYESAFNPGRDQPLVATIDGFDPNLRGLQISALSAVDGTVHGDIVNAGRATIRDVTVYCASGEQDVGTLTPGEHRAWSMAPAQTGPPPVNSGVSVSNWNRWHQTPLQVWQSPGEARAIGWIAGYRPLGISVRGARSFSGSAAVLAADPVEAEGSGISDETVSSAYLHVGQAGRPAFPRQALSFRLVLPHGLNAGEQVLLANAAGVGFEIWDGSRWASAPPASASGDIAIARSALVRNVLYLRSSDAQFTYSAYRFRVRVTT